MSSRTQQALTALQSASKKHGGTAANITSLGGLGAALIYAFNLVSDNQLKLTTQETRIAVLEQQLKAHTARDWTPKHMGRWVGQAKEANFGKGVVWPDPLITLKEMRDDVQ